MPFIKGGMGTSTTCAHGEVQVGAVHVLLEKHLTLDRPSIVNSTEPVVFDRVEASRDKALKPKAWKHFQSGRGNIRYFGIPDVFSHRIHLNPDSPPFDTCIECVVHLGEAAQREREPATHARPSHT